MIIMPRTVWRRYGNRYASSAFRSFEQPQVAVEVVVDIDRAVDVDIDVAVAAPPVPATEDRAAGGDPGTEQEAGHGGRAVAIARCRRGKDRRRSGVEAPRAQTLSGSCEGGG